MKFYYLTLDEILSLPRRERTIAEMAKVNYPTEEFVGVRKYIEATGCTYSQFLIASKVYQDGDEVMGFFEDDVKILNPELFNQQVETALADPSWDIFYFSFHPPKAEFRIVGENENHYQIKGMLGTHAIMYRKKMINAILADTTMEGRFRGRINIDVAIRDNSPDMVCKCPKDMAVTFYDGRSTRADQEFFDDIEQRLLTQFERKKAAWNSKSNN